MIEVKGALTWMYELKDGVYEYGFYDVEEDKEFKLEEKEFKDVTR